MLLLVLCSCTQSYTVTFKNYDGTVLETVKVKEGELPISTVAPTKAAGEIYNYIFSGWDKEIAAAYSDAEYSATFKEVPGTVKWFEGKKIVFLGDSITNCHSIDNREIYGYPFIVTNTLNAEIVEMGTNSRTLCQGGHRHSCLDDISDIPADADIVIVALGNNDWDQAVKDGMYGGTREYAAGATYYTLGEVGTDDTSTIRGAAAAYCERIRERLVKDEAIIYFMTPLICGWNRSIDKNIKSDYDFDKKNIHGFTQTELVDAIIEVCESYGVGVIDVYRNSGVNETNAAEYYVDGIHPNVAGHQAIADEVLRALKEDILIPAE